MQGSLKDRMQQLEVAPPPAVWDKISAALDEEFAATDGMVATKMLDAEIEAPEGVWEAINEQLNNEGEAAPKVRIITFWKVAAAAAAIGLIALISFYFLNNTNETTPQVVSTVTVPRTVDSPRVAPQVTTPPTEENVANTPAIKAPATNPQPRNTKPFQSSFAVNTPSPIDEDFQTLSPEEAPIYELTTVSALQPVSVSAPPIRDKKGNLIMDMATISNPDDPYITVTGPNGTQTKISTKFLSCLSYMNANLSSADLDASGVGCMLQFDEWRKRLLTEPAFVPAANNFFDIFELKDLLQEM